MKTNIRFHNLLSGYLGSMATYWFSVRDALAAIDAFAKCNDWSRYNSQGDNPAYDDAEGRVTLTFTNVSSDKAVYVYFAWYTMQSGRKEITVYVS